MKIGLLGYGECGKSTIGKYLAENYKYHCLSFSDPIIKMLLAVNPIVAVSLEDYTKLWKNVETDEKLVYLKILAEVRIGAKNLTSFDDTYLEFYYFKDLHEILGYVKSKQIQMVREYYQRMGTDAARKVIGEDVWVNIAEPIIYKYENLLVENVRFRNEAKKITDCGGILVEVTRPDFGAVNSHISDTGIPFDLATHLIENNSDKSSLYSIVDDFLLFPSKYVKKNAT